MAETMKALAKTGPVEGLELIDAPVPQAGPEDVLIKVHRAAVCGTDIHIWNWDEWSQKNVPTPMITGHEFAGEIVSVGKDVDRPLKVGQRVSAEGHVIDLNSEAARAGHFHLDPHTRGIGVNRQGAFAEYVVAPAFNVIELPDDVPYEIGSILDPFGNAVHTAQQFDLLGEDVLVTGAGPIGMMVALAALAGAFGVVVLYAVCSILYSFKLKSMALVDLFMLAALYTIRLFGGGEARWVLTIFSIVVSAGLAWWALKADRRLLVAAIGLVMGGALGNVIDRVRFGYVVDFIDFSGTGIFPWVFNVADSAITVGVVLLILDSLKSDRPAQVGAAPEKS